MPGGRSPETRTYVRGSPSGSCAASGASGCPTAVVCEVFSSSGPNDGGALAGGAGAAGEGAGDGGAGDGGAGAGGVGAGGAGTGAAAVTVTVTVVVLAGSVLPSVAL